VKLLLTVMATLECIHIVFYKLLLDEFSSISCLKVPWCYHSFKSTPSIFQLHGFSDASSLAYGAFLYLKTIYTDGNVTVRIVAAKTRVSRVKIWLQL